jgi:surface protein
MPGIHNGIGTTFRNPAFGGGAAPANPDSGTIDWGDGGGTSTLSYANRAHVYTTAGTYNITISGSDIQGFQFNNSGDKAKITDISNWGNLTITSTGAFYGCSNLDITATDAPTFTTTSLLSTFRGCTSLTTPDFTAWDVSGITNLQSMFHSCSNFNGDVSTWDTSNVTTFGLIQAGIGFGTFYNCTSFNGDISGWSFASAADINGLLWNCQAFNQDVTGWDVSNVTSMYGLFYNCDAFNQDISGWNVGNVTNMGSMFKATALFNQDLSSWDVSSVTSAIEMFRDAISFNQDITFLINNSSITSLVRVLYAASSFNQDVSGWNVSSVTDFSGLFRNCNAVGFNPDVSGWDMSSATTLSDGQGGILQNCDGFDRDLSSWDVTSITTANYFMSVATGMSTANYDATLIGWEATLAAAYPSGVGSPNVTINFGGSQYSSALMNVGEARYNLVNVFGWTITDGGAV